MKEIIFTGFLFVLVFWAGSICGTYDAHEISSTPKSDYTDQEYLGDLNLCTHMGSTCEGWNCLCETHNRYGYQTGFCQDYETYCVGTICESITVRVNGVYFIERPAKYTECGMIYDKTIMLDIIDTGIKLNDIDQNTFECLAEFRNNMSVPDAYRYTFQYENGRFYDNNRDRIDC